MTESADNISVSREQLRNLLATARGNAPVDEVDVKTVDYDWKRPHQFNDGHRVILSQFCTPLAVELADVFSTACNDPSRVTIPPVEEYYCNGLREELQSEKSNYYMVFTDDNHREVGVLIIPHLSAIQWSAKMLGDTEPEVSEDYELSNLEESLLVDLCNAVIKRLSASLTKNELKAVNSQLVLTNRDWPIECLDYEEFSLLQLQVEHTEGKIDASLAILSPLLGPMLEIHFADETQANSQEVKDAVISNINKIPIEVDVLVGNANIAMSNLMTISKGDVIVLDRKAQDPVEAIIEGKVFFHGYPAKTMNRYAISVTDIMTPGEELINN